MHDTELHLRERPGGPDRVRKALQAVAADDEAVADAAVAELGQQGEPVLGTLPTGRPDPHPHDVTFAVQIDAHRHIHRPVRDRAVADLDHDRVDQTTGYTRSSGLLCQLSRSSTMVSVILLIVSFDTSSRRSPPIRLDVTGRETLRVQRDDVARQAVETTLTLTHRLRVEAGVAVPRNPQLHLTDLRRDRLAVVPVAAVTGPATLRGVGFIAQVVGHLPTAVRLATAKSASRGPTERVLPAATGPRPRPPSLADAAPAGTQSRSPPGLTWSEGIYTPSGSGWIDHSMTFVLEPARSVAWGEQGRQGSLGRQLDLHLRPCGQDHGGTEPGSWSPYLVKEGRNVLGLEYTVSRATTPGLRPASSS